MNYTNKPIFVISIDLELAWGSIDRDEIVFNERVALFKKTRQAIDELLVLFEKYNISATWASVGHLFLSECNLVEGVKHKEIVRSNYSWVDGDWFDRDPATNIKKDDIWYGEDILDKLLNAKVKQEIGFHGFSHMIFDKVYMSRETADSEVAACVTVAKNKNISVKSFVFPRNYVGFIDVLKKNGIIAYRGNSRRWYSGFNKRLQAVCHIIDQFFTITPPTSKSKAYKGMVNVKDSMMYISRDGFRRYIPIKSRVLKAKKGIDKAIGNNEVFHMWFHPFNMVNDQDRLLNGLEEILKYVDNKRREGNIEVMSIGEIAELLVPETVNK